MRSLMDIMYGKFPWFSELYFTFKKYTLYYIRIEIVLVINNRYFMYFES